MDLLTPSFHTPPILSAALLMLFAACSSGPETPGGKTAGAPVAVEGLVVSNGVVSGSIRVAGTIHSLEETVLYPEVSGRVVSLHIPEGQPVKQGTLLVKLFDGDLQAQLRKLEAQFGLAEETVKRLSTLIQSGGVSQQELDQAQLSKAMLQADADMVRAQIDKTEIHAPYDGVLGLRQISPGAFVTTQQALCTIRNHAGLKLDFSVAGKYSQLVAEGVEVHFTVAGDTTNYTARVAASEESAEEDTRTLEVRAVVIPGSGSLLPGSFAEVDVPLATRGNAILIPTQCIIPQARNKLVIVNRNGKAEFVKVTTGVRQEKEIEITGGLVPGDTVATTGVLFLRPGAPLVFSKINQTP